MATQLFLTSVQNGLGIPSTTAAANLTLALSRGSGVVSTDATNTFAGPVHGTSLKVAGATAPGWAYGPLNAVTLSGNVTLNFWMAESNAMANVGAEVRIYIFDAALNFKFNLMNALTDAAARSGVEMGTTQAAQNWVATPPVSRDVPQGGYVVVQMEFGDAGGTQASGNTCTGQYAGTSSAAAGDSFATFTETLTIAATALPFQSAEGPAFPPDPRPGRARASGFLYAWLAAAPLRDPSTRLLKWR